MLKGNIINGYKILKDFTTAGGGLSKWTFAEKGGKVFFIKEFLSPKYPTETSPGSPKTKDRKRKECEKFEKHHKALMAQINEKCGIGGNLVFTLDFFRSASTYYKVTEKIDVASLSTDEMYHLPISAKILILKTISHSLGILHKAGIVHGDLKPDNILIKQTRTNFYTTKLIDFDNSYFSGKAPEIHEEMVGDMVFYSPELARYVQGKEASENLTSKSDIFALGLLYCIYLQGSLPEYPKKYMYACLAANEGKELKLVDARLPAKIKKIVNAMLSYAPEQRPEAEEIFELLKNINLEEEEIRLEKETRKSYVESYGEEKKDEESHKLKISFAKKTAASSPREEESKLKGKGLRIFKK